MRCARHPLTCSCRVHAGSALPLCGTLETAQTRAGALGHAAPGAALPEGGGTPRPMPWPRRAALHAAEPDAAGDRAADQHRTQHRPSRPLPRVAEVGADGRLHRARQPHAGGRVQHLRRPWAADIVFNAPGLKRHVRPEPVPAGAAGATSSNRCRPGRGRACGVAQPSGRHQRIRSADGQVPMPLLLRPGGRRLAVAAQALYVPERARRCRSARPLRAA